MNARVRWLPFALLLAVASGAQGQGAETEVANAASTPRSVPAAAATLMPSGMTLPPDYTIGPEDVLAVVFWRDTELSAEAVVRPDGKVTLPLLNDIPAAGLTPEELRAKIIDEASRFLAEPNATVVIKQMNSRKVFITGEVEKPGAYPLNAPMRVLQLIALAGGLKEFAKRDEIFIVRFDRGQQVAYPFHYQSVLLDRRRLGQNIELKPGDTIVVP